VDSEDTEDLRAVTIVVLLADDGAFDGGDFQVRSGGGRPGVKPGKPRSVPLRAGDAIGFPSQRLEHRVLPVTRGLRQSIVFWAKRR
jgi:predicted 2-oxoglutarate/Fe(II)-dependent dioxygenase YbiX